MSKTINVKTNGKVSSFTGRYPGLIQQTDLLLHGLHSTRAVHGPDSPEYLAVSVRFKKLYTTLADLAEIAGVGLEEVIGQDLLTRERRYFPGNRQKREVAHPVLAVHPISGSPLEVKAHVGNPKKEYVEPVQSPKAVPAQATSPVQPIEHPKPAQPRAVAEPKRPVEIPENPFVKQKAYMITGYLAPEDIETIKGVDRRFVLARRGNYGAIDITLPGEIPLYRRSQVDVIDADWKGPLGDKWRADQEAKAKESKN